MNNSYDSEYNVEKLEKCLSAYSNVFKISDGSGKVLDIYTLSDPIDEKIVSLNNAILDLYIAIENDWRRISGVKRAIIEKRKLEQEMQ